MDDEFQAAHFFEMFLPLWLADAGPRAGLLEAAVRFDLVMGEECRSFCADFREGGRGWFEGPFEDPDLLITLDENLVLPMILGDLDVDLALESGALAVSGSLETLERWSALFNDSMQGMSALYASIRQREFS